MVKSQIDTKSAILGKDIFENPRESIINSEFITSDAFLHAVKSKSYLGLRYIINGTKELKLKVDDSIIEEILCTYDTIKGSEVILLLISVNAMLENEDKKTKQLENYVSEIRHLSFPDKSKLRTMKEEIKEDAQENIQDLDFDNNIEDEEITKTHSN